MSAVLHNFLDFLVDATPWFLGGAILGAVRVVAFVVKKMLVFHDVLTSGETGD